ncbi:MAG: hypothetical protein JSU69_07805 [Candidatus Zixiibacteriota bacterium]|nr:MAG: hypothetical protein JSU69_07805 [candidate division Zixibacteria bacterium]
MDYKQLWPALSSHCEKYEMRGKGCGDGDMLSLGFKKRYSLIDKAFAFGYI